MGKEFGHSTFATVHLAEYFDNIFKKNPSGVQILQKDKTQKHIAEKFITREFDIVTKIENPKKKLQVCSILQQVLREEIYSILLRIVE